MNKLCLMKTTINKPPYSEQRPFSLQLGQTSSWSHVLSRLSMTPRIKCHASADIPAIFHVLMKRRHYINRRVILFWDDHWTGKYCTVFTADHMWGSHMGAVALGISKTNLLWAFFDISNHLSRTWDPKRYKQKLWLFFHKLSASETKENSLRWLLSLMFITFKHKS